MIKKSQSSFDTMRMLGTASSFAICMALAQPAYAQDTQQDEEEGTDAPVTEEEGTIVISGYLKSLDTAQDIKRNADTFVDVISAEDIGALPDRSVAESLQRVPGVNISRFEQRDDPDRFSVEGSGVIIRGLPFVRSELNGRDIFSANGGRTLGFNDVSPELLGRVEVFKNQTADMIEGGISGSVNLVTRKPLDNPGFKIAGTLEANVGDLAEEWSPGFSVLASNTFEGGGGTFGMQFGYAQQELVTRTDASQITDPCYRDVTLDSRCYRIQQPTDSSSFTGDVLFDATNFPPDGTIIAPKGAGVRTTDLSRDRRAYSAVGQFESNDGRLRVTAEFLRAETEATLSEYSMLAQVNNDAYFPVIAAGTNPVIVNGQLVSATLSQTSQDGIVGIPTEMLRFQREDDAMTQDVSFDVEFEATDRLRFNAGVQKVKSDRNEDGIILAMRTFTDIFYDYQGETPVVQFLQRGEGGSGNLSTDVSNPDRTYYWFNLDNQVRNEGDLFALNGDVEYDISDTGFLRQAKFGARWGERDRTTRSANFNTWGGLGDTWTSRGGDWGWGQNDPSRFLGAGGGSYVSDFPDYANLYSPFGNDFQRGAVPVPTGPAFFYGSEDLIGQYTDRSLAAELDAIKAFNLIGGLAESEPLLYQRVNTAEGVFTDGEISKVGEDTLGLYGRLDFGKDFASGMELDGNIGLRYVRTTVKSAGQIGFPMADQIDAPIDIGGVNYGGNGNGVADLADLQNRCANVQPGQLPGGACSLSAERQAEFVAAFNGETFDDSADITYDNWLPSLNAKLDIGNGMLVRGAVSKGLFRPDLAAYKTGGFLGDYTRALVEAGTLETGPLFVIGTGNRNLRPTTSWNFDLSFEYYFADVGSLSVAGFVKKIDGVVNGDAELRTITNPNTGASYDVLIEGPFNSDSGTVKGVELAHQQVYDFLPGPLSGFGTQLTYTYVDGGSFSNSTLGADQSPLADGLPLAGISKHTVNAVLFYEKYDLSARLAYNWRSDFLQTPRDVIFPYSPIYGESTGQLDASIFYSITPHIKAGVQGVNLLDEVTTTSQQIDYTGTRVVRSAFRNDRRFSFLLRFDF